MFQPVYRTTRFCSPDCSSAANYRRKNPGWRRRFPFLTKGRVFCRVRDRPKVRRFVAGWCLGCGDPFVVAAGKGDKYCSPACGKKVGHRVRWDRRRAAQGAERVYRLKVYERDSWTCRLCSKPIDREAVVPDPYAATLDHVVPLSLGGSHTYLNVQAAHFICNSKKGDHVVQLSFAA